MLGLRLLRLAAALLPEARLHAVCRKNVPEPGDEAAPLTTRDVRFVPAEPEQAAALEALAPEATDRALLDRRWRERQLCIVAESGSAPVGYGWLCQRMAMLEMGIAKADAPDILLAEPVVAPTPAGAALAPGLERAMLRQARDLGAKRAFRVVDAARRQPLDAAVAGGWTVTGAVLLLGGWRTARPRLWLVFGRVYPLQLLQALEDEAKIRHDIPLGRLVRRSLVRPFQWLRHGVFHLRLLSILTWLLGRFGESRLIFIYRRDLQKPFVPQQARVPVTVGRASEADAEALAALEGEDADQVEIYRNRLSRGDQCFVARIDGRIVATDWMRFGTAWSWVDIRVEDGDIYMTDAYAAPEWRGNRIAAAVHSQMLAYAQRQGFRHAYSILDANNANSWAMLPRMGWELTGVLLSFQSRAMDERRFWTVSGSPYPMLIDGRKNVVDPERPVD
jgi:ribosomal protein S18 acetylase RimI-like enzyme